MKKLLLISILSIAIVSCMSDSRYTQKSAEIDVVKQHINNYNEQTYDVSLMSENSFSFFNSTKDSISRGDLIAYHQANDKNYASRGFLDENQEFEMVVTDDGNTWVNAWLVWSGTLNGSDKAIEMPIHLTYKFEDGKIVRELGYWDPTQIQNEAEAIAARANAESSSPGAGSTSPGGGSDTPQVQEVSSIEEQPMDNNSDAAKANTQNLSATIAERLRNPNFDVDENSKARIRLTVNSANQIVVLGVDGGNNDVKEFILDRLNYYHLDYDFDDKLKTYTVPVLLVSE